MRLVRTPVVRSTRWWPCRPRLSSVPCCLAFPSTPCWSALPSLTHTTGQTTHTHRGCSTSTVRLRLSEVQTPKLQKCYFTVMFSSFGEGSWSVSADVWKTPHLFPDKTGKHNCRILLTHCKIYFITTVTPPGGIDPWQELSVVRDGAEEGAEEQVIFIEDTAHCADMMTGGVADRSSLKKARWVWALYWGHKSQSHNVLETSQQ